MTREERVAELISLGYVEKDSVGQLKVGQRVRHIGERYYQALDNGTGVLRDIYQKPNDPRDIEVVVMRDDGGWGLWADYHTVPVIPFDV